VSQEIVSIFKELVTSDIEYYLVTRVLPDKIKGNQYYCLKVWRTKLQLIDKSHIRLITYDYSFDNDSLRINGNEKGSDFRRAFSSQLKVIMNDLSKGNVVLYEKKVSPLAPRSTQVSEVDISRTMKSYQEQMVQNQIYQMSDEELAKVTGGFVGHVISRRSRGVDPSDNRHEELSEDDVLSLLVSEKILSKADLVALRLVSVKIHRGFLSTCKAFVRELSGEVSFPGSQKKKSPSFDGVKRHKHDIQRVAGSLDRIKNNIANAFTLTANPKPRGALDSALHPYMEAVLLVQTYDASRLSDAVRMTVESEVLRAIQHVMVEACITAGFAKSQEVKRTGVAHFVSTQLPSLRAVSTVLSPSNEEVKLGNGQVKIKSFVTRFVEFTQHYLSPLDEATV
jgi:hypothetical protein